MNPIIEYIESCPEERKPYLSELYNLLVDLLPESEQKIAWGMPSFKQKNAYVVHFNNFKNHIGLFPGPDVVAAMREELKDYTITKASVHLDPKEPLPKELIRKLVAKRLELLG